ncbi:hypothetical protein DSM14862_04114 (plasmid) [Sulfitobacter indolifex]|uniref:Uncharacterized protein n=1 Tax=Sulfitobacter indolifex HEL-45 TaxID=391624 RepID=A0ABP2D5H0_9RHOB|nr:hypothetical protein [Sulfitobacter indolifex]EDQ03442.1 hypothetical protein OIHEL45_16746 [Sulfitobacter indolifex HEL-45]UOA21274.1 hypothetical protein DSM14862_04114 [Sulfitobacter indolifex]
MRSTPIKIAQTINADPSVYMPPERPAQKALAGQHQGMAGARFDLGGYMMEFGRAAVVYYRKDTPAKKTAQLAKAGDALLGYLKSYAAHVNELGDVGWSDPRPAWSRYPAVANDPKGLAPVLALLDMPGVRFVFTCLYAGADFSMSDKLTRLLSPEEPFVIFSSDRQAYNVIQNALKQLGEKGIDLTAFFKEMAQLAALEQKRA